MRFLSIENSRLENTIRPRHDETHLITIFSVDMEPEEATAACFIPI
jgi:hypothetical protein